MNDKKKLRGKSVFEDALAENNSGNEEEVVVLKSGSRKGVQLEDVTYSVLDCDSDGDEAAVMSEDEEVVTDVAALKSEKSSANKFYLYFYDMISTVMSAFVIIAIIFVFAFRLVGVSGESMTNTLQDGDWLLTVNKQEYVQGDIIVITQDTSVHKPLIKRVIATGGQWIDIDYETNTVLVDGVAIIEPYVKEAFMIEKSEYREFPYQVPEGMLFCMGDNRNGSSDSRSYGIGPIDEREVLGKAVVRLVPFGDFSIYDYD